MEMQCTVLVFQPNWSHQAFNLEILFLSQEFGQIFVCQYLFVKLGISLGINFSNYKFRIMHCSGYSLLGLFKNMYAENLLSLVRIQF